MTVPDPSSGHVVPRNDAKTDVVGDRHSLIRVGMAAVWFACLVFAVQRLVVALQTGLPTPWWGNAAGLVAVTALWAWYRRGPQTRSSGAAHGTALVATMTLLIPIAYGMTSTIWWLSLVGFATVLLGRRQEAVVWGVTIPLLVAASVIAEPYVQIRGAAGEPARSTSQPHRPVVQRVARDRASREAAAISGRCARPRPRSCVFGPVA